MLRQDGDEALLEDGALDVLGEGSQLSRAGEDLVVGVDWSAGKESTEVVSGAVGSDDLVGIAAREVVGELKSHSWSAWCSCGNGSEGGDSGDERELHFELFKVGW